jgi:hypothetical protein
LLLLLLLLLLVVFDHITRCLCSASLFAVENRQQLVSSA